MWWWRSHILLFLRGWQYILCPKLFWRHSSCLYRWSKNTSLKRGRIRSHWFNGSLEISYSIILAWVTVFCVRNLCWRSWKHLPCLYRWSKNTSQKRGRIRSHWFNGSLEISYSIILAWVTVFCVRNLCWRSWKHFPCLYRWSKNTLQKKTGIRSHWM